jgi:FMN phosphatase YigB (HAD superfamily)
VTQKGILLFDIDRTIFDTSKLTAALVSSLSKTLDIEVSEIRKETHIFVASLNADREFDPEKFTKYLCNKFNFENQKLLLAVFYNKKNKHWYTDFIFPETFIVFDRLINKFRLGIFSEGTKKFQNYKFESMGISKYLYKELIFVLDHKTNPGALAKIPQGSIVVDDKESVCEYLSDNGIKTVWLNKKDDRKNEKFPTIHNLLELPGKLM